ncbi:ABC transporter ATP-binding protein [Paenibacillus sp. FJAT-26967]|uniref:ABC transporter ATP-binding protein n=1 Tax=Paenibacillus sp. FJAT-26967 TaxID=1729690 RepID=UPI000837CC74|nr:ABC transporter ATP-binding protein [Paenibacillus sp. FJAT-26967]
MSSLSFSRVPVYRYYLLLRAYLSDLLKQILFLAVLVALNIALQLVNPQILRFFIDSATDPHSSALLFSALLFVGLAAAQLLLSVTADYSGEKIGWTAANRLRAHLLRHCLSLDLAFFKTRSGGELIDRIDGDVKGLAGFFSTLTVSLLGNIGLILGVIAVVFYENSVMGAFMSVYVGLALAVFNKMRAYSVPLWVRFGDARADFFAFVGEQLAATEDVRSSGAVPYSLYRFRKLMRSWFPLHMKAGFGFSFMWASSTVLVGVGTLLILVPGFYLREQGLVTTGTLYMMIFYMGLLAGPLDAIRELIENLQRAEANIKRVGQLLDLTPDIRESSDAAELADGPVSVQCRSLTFGYSKEETVLREIQFRLEAGESLGIVGRSGSGKTSLVRLLVRLYDPLEGDVLLGGMDIRRIQLRHLRDRVGLITQDVQIFNGTVRENLTLFKPDIPDDKIMPLLEETGLGAWFSTLPDGLDTVLPSGGGGLSAGEAQLLAYVRVFLKDPGLVILDEASSRLDPVTEKRLERTARKLLQGRTSILISHRPGMLRHADRILVMDSGRIAEQGSREQLLKRTDSRFSQLIRQGTGKESL